MCLSLTRLLDDLREYSQEIYIKGIQDVETRNKQTNRMVTHKKWVRSGTEGWGDGDQTDIDI